MQHVFTAVFTKDDDDTMLVSFPDLPGCYAQGASMLDAVKKAESVLSLCLFDMEQNGIPIPTPRHPEEINLKPGEVTSVILINTDAYHTRFGKKFANHVVAMPAWLGHIAESSDMNLSQMLQNAVRQEIGMPTLQLDLVKSVDTNIAESSTPFVAAVSAPPEAEAMQEETDISVIGKKLTDLQISKSQAQRKAREAMAKKNQKENKAKAENRTEKPPKSYFFYVMAFLVPLVLLSAIAFSAVTWTTWGRNIPLLRNITQRSETIESGANYQNTEGRTVENGNPADQNTVISHVYDDNNEHEQYSNEDDNLLFNSYEETPYEIYSNEADIQYEYPEDIAEYNDGNIYNDDPPLYNENEDDNYTDTPHYEGYYENNDSNNEDNNIPYTVTPEPSGPRSPEIIALVEYYNNPEVVGRIIINGTNIDYAIVQHDNNDFYRSHDIRRNPTQHGWIYVDSSLVMGSESNNTVLFGPMVPGTLFYEIGRFADYNLFSTSWGIRLVTDHENNRWEPFSFYTDNGEHAFSPANYRNWNQWIENFAGRTIHPTTVTVSENDRIITIIATQPNSSRRYILHARLVD